MASRELEYQPGEELGTASNPFSSQETEQFKRYKENAQKSSPWWMKALMGAGMAGVALPWGTLLGGAGGSSGAAAGAGAAGTGAASSAGLAGVAGGAGTAGAAAGTAGGAGLLSKIPSILSTLGSVASGASAGRAAGRVDEAGINNRQDQLRLQAAQILEQALQGRGNLDLNQRQYALQAPQQRASNSRLGDVMANAQDASISGPVTGTKGRVPSISGGLRPSLMSANTRQLGQNMSRDALLQNTSGADTFTPLPAMQIPSITPTPEASGLDTGLNWLGGIGTGLAALNESGVLDNYYTRLQQQKQIPQIPQETNPNSPYEYWEGS